MSCQDTSELVPEFEISISGENLMNLGATQTIREFEVNSNTDWEIEAQGDWFFVSPVKGRGNSLVTLYVESTIDEDREGALIVHFSGFSRK